MALYGGEQFTYLFPLLGQKVELRLFSTRHITEDYLGWLNDPLVMRYSNQRFKQHHEASCLTYLQTFQGSGNLFLAIHLANSGRFVGTMTTHFSIVHETADMGILVGDRTCWGQGIGKDAWSTLMSLLLVSGNVRKVSGGTLRCNVGMVNVMRNTGMIPDGVRSCQELVDGVPQDILHFARFRIE